MARESALLSPSLRRTTSMAAPRFGGLADCSVRIAVHWLSGLPAQTGQPQRCFPVRLLMTDFHAWPFSHSHQAFRLLPDVTCCGVKLPLRVGCHCDAITGSLVSRSLNPGRTLRLVQYGQSLSLFTRWAMTAQKECPLSQSHHTRRLEYALTASGVSAPFFFQSHCSASCGCSEARSLNPGRTFCPAQNGQPAFDVTRLATLACQLCPFGHLHQTFRCAPGMTCVGSSGEFFSVSHSESRSGNFAAREFSSGRTARPAQTGQPVPRVRILTSER